jgi:hypothetical protein
MAGLEPAFLIPGLQIICRPICRRLAWPDDPVFQSADWGAVCKNKRCGVLDAPVKPGHDSQDLPFREGIEKNQPRILIGNDARFMDLLQRFRPGTFWAVLARRIEKMAKVGK